MEMFYKLFFENAVKKAELFPVKLFSALYGHIPTRCKRLST